MLLCGEPVGLHPCDMGSGEAASYRRLPPLEPQGPFKARTPARPDGAGCRRGKMPAPSLEATSAAPWRMSFSRPRSRRARRRASTRQDRAGDDRRGAVWMEARTSRRCATVARQARQQPLAAACPEAVAVHALGVVGVELLVDRGERGGGARHGDHGVHARAHVGGDVGLHDRARVRRQRGQLGRGRGVAVQVALVAHRGHRVETWNSGSPPGGRRRTRCCRRRCRSRASPRRRRGPRSLRGTGRASSSPEIVRASRPKRRSISSRNSGPLAASRMALVATATTRPAASASR